jgi:hypothetical protein
MKLWILKARVDLVGEDDLWEPWYDKNFAFIVRAEDELSARIIAGLNAYDETKAAWLCEKYSTCEELKSDGEVGVVMADCRNG